MYVQTFQEYTSLAEKRRRKKKMSFADIMKKQADDAKQADAEKSDDKKDTKSDCKIDIDINVK